MHRQVRQVCTVLALFPGFTIMRTISLLLMMSMSMRMRMRRRWMACQMPVGTGLKMGWGGYTGDRGILARCTIRVINRHTLRNTSNLPTGTGDTKSNANKRRYETQSLANVSAVALPDIRPSWTYALGPRAHAISE